MRDEPRRPLTQKQKERKFIGFHETCSLIGHAFDRDHSSFCCPTDKVHQQPGPASLRSAIDDGTHPPSTPAPHEDGAQSEISETRADALHTQPTKSKQPKRVQPAPSPADPSRQALVIVKGTKKAHRQQPGPKACNTKNNLKKSISKVHEKMGCGRAKAAEDRSAQALSFASQWVNITENEQNGTISSGHASCLRASWQLRVGELGQFQQKRCHQRVDKLHDEWLTDPSLQRRLDQPWMDALATMEYVSSCPICPPEWCLPEPTISELACVHAPRLQRNDVKPAQ
jgi:hypothetical protein